MEKELKKVYGQYQSTHFNDEIASRIKEKVQHEIHNEGSVQPKRKQLFSFTKKLSYAVATSFALFGIFIGSAFISPTMAEVASKIPFLNQILEQRPLNEVLMESLTEQGYNIIGTGYSVHGKTYFVTVNGNEEYFNQVKDEIAKITEEIVSSRGYDDFKIEVEQAIEVTDYEPKNEDEVILEQTLDVINNLVPTLQEQGYKIHAPGIQYTAQDARVIQINFQIEDTELRTAEIEKSILDAIQKQDINKEVTIKFYPFNVKDQEIEGIWTTHILPVIWDGMLGKKEYKTKGVGYSYKKGIMNIYITTTIKKSDKDAPKLAKKIETAIEEFIQSDDLKDLVGDNPYKVIVRDKKGKDIME